MLKRSHDFILWYKGKYSGASEKKTASLERTVHDISFPMAFLDLREEDNLSIGDKIIIAGPKVSFIQRLHCT